MRFGLYPPEEDSLKGNGIFAYVEHDDQKLEWLVTDVLDKNRIKTFDPFEQVNLFLTELSPVSQEKIWLAYNECFEILRANIRPIVLIQQLQKQIKLIYDEIDQSKIENFVNGLVFSREIIVPKRYSEHYIQNEEKPTTPEKTYTRQDYLRLISLSIALRLMIPIWGEFISLTKHETGTTHKKLIAYSLLAKTNLVKSAAIEKLTLYIAQNLKEDHSLTTAVVEHIGREDYVAWILASVVLERVCSSDIRGNEDTLCLVVMCYHFIHPFTQANTNSNSFGEQVKEKKFASGDGGDQDPSRLECYKIKSEHSQGQISAHQVYLRDSNIHKVARRVYPDIDLDLFEEFKQANMELLKTDIQHCQICLMAWMLKPAFSPRAAFHIRKEYVDGLGSSLINGLTIGQTILWQTNHKKLALLATSIPISNDDAYHIGGYGTVSRILKDQNAKLEALYPYKRIPIGKPNTKVVNPAINAINSIADDFLAREWMLTAPDSILTQYSKEEIKIHRRISAPHEIKILLADLAIQIAEKAKANYVPFSETKWS
jgi:hypothetical protein